jgi:acyl-CoA thioesterase YciA
LIPRRIDPGKRWAAESIFFIPGFIMPDYTDPAIRLTLLPRDTNPQGTIFGGIILSYIDMAGAIEAHRHTKIERFVTVAMREVIFHQPVFVGDLVSFYAKTLRIGTTSITVRVIVEAERYGGTSDRIRVTEAEVIYVAVDANRRKMRIAKKEEDK